jgi:hypothetical protein
MSQSQPPYGFIVGDRWYGICCWCQKLVRIDKPILGSLHFCLTEDQKRARSELSRQQRAASSHHTIDEIARKVYGLPCA